MSTGSLMNNLVGRTANPEPEIGMGVTRLCWTDRHAYTIVEIKSPKLVIIQRDTAIRTDSYGMSDSQSYEYISNPDGERVMISLRKTGNWHKVGESTSSEKYAMGFRQEYYDYSF